MRRFTGQNPARSSTRSGLVTGSAQAAVHGCTERVGRQLAAERGLQFTRSGVGEYVGGTLSGSTNLASGRFAMIEDGLSFQLVPWQPVLEKRIGQHVTGVMCEGGGIDWGFGRKRGLGL